MTVSSEQTWFYMQAYVKKSLPGSTQLPTIELLAVETRRPPKTDVGTETAFRLDQRKHFRKSKQLLRSKVS